MVNPCTSAGEIEPTAAGIAKLAKPCVKSEPSPTFKLPCPTPIAPGEEIVNTISNDGAIAPTSADKV